MHASPPDGAARRERYRSLLAPLTVALATLLLGVAFAWVGSEVLEGDTRSLDTALLHGAQALRLDHPWLAGTMRDLSGLGSTVALTLFTVATVAYLLLQSSPTMATLVALSVSSGAVSVRLLKAGFARLRPDSAFAELVVDGMSFPSGHASMAALVFLTVGALLASTRTRLRERSFILGMAATMTLLVGISRVLLGVHWVTDVLGGWAFGTAWALAWLLLARWLTARRGAPQST